MENQARASLVQKVIQKHIRDGFPSRIELSDTTLASPEALVGLLKRIHTLQALSIAHSLTLDDEHLAKFCPNLTCLEELTIASCRKLAKPWAMPSRCAAHCSHFFFVCWSSAQVLFLANSAKFGVRLKKLSLLDTALADPQIETIAQIAPNIESLNLSGNVKLTHEGLQKLVSGGKLKKLGEVVVGSYLDPRDSQIISNAVVKDFISTDLSQTLIALDLSGTKIGTAESNSTSNSLSSSGSMSRLFSSSSSSSSPALSEAPFASIFKYCQGIKSLHLGHSTVGDAVLKSIFKKCTRLEVRPRPTPFFSSKPNNIWPYADCYT